MLREDYITPLRKAYNAESDPRKLMELQAEVLSYELAKFDCFKRCLFDIRVQTAFTDLMVQLKIAMGQRYLDLMSPSFDPYTRRYRRLQPRDDRL